MKDKVIEKLLEHDRKFEEIDKRFDDVQDTMTTRFDEILVIVQRLDQERVFTFETVKRMQKELERQGKELQKVKRILKIA